MKKQLLMKTAVGLGLVAGSLAASATINGESFGSPAIYARSGATPYYGIFLPSGNTSTDMVVLVEAVQGTTTNTWSYVVGAETLCPTVNKCLTDRGALVTAATDSGAANAYAMAQIDNGETAGTFKGLWLQPAALSTTQVITYPFAQITAGTGASSAMNCSMTFEASINSAEALVYKMLEMRPGNWVPANITVGTNATFQLQTGTAAAASFSGTWSDYFGGANKGYLPVSTFSLGGNAYASGAYSMLTWSGQYSFMNGGAMSSSSTATSFNMGSAGQIGANMCMTARAAREALNNSGLIGGSQGMVKIW